jgi:hypothetical protein
MLLSSLVGNPQLATSSLNKKKSVKQNFWIAEKPKINILGHHDAVNN